LEIINAYRELGSYHAAAKLCGTTHKTVRRIVERQQGAPPAERPRRPRTADVVVDLIAERVERTQGRISAKRLLPAARAAGYEGSDRASAARWPTRRRRTGSGAGSSGRGCR